MLYKEHAFHPKPENSISQGRRESFGAIEKWFFRWKRGLKVYQTWYSVYKSQNLRPFKTHTRCKCDFCKSVCYKRIIAKRQSNHSFQLSLKGGNLLLLNRWYAYFQHFSLNFFLIFIVFKTISERMLIQD